ncbi:MAG: FkbM family methyltransferase [Thaumarchaeota archaeon]|nr:FkbM family methyltransferase [Nitrososphaerota archaeon]
MTLENVHPSSPIVRVLTETKYVRVLGRRIFPVYEAKLPGGGVIHLRAAFDWDASTLEEVVYKDIYEKERKIMPGDVVLDVGAHIGSFTLKAAKEVGPEGRVVSFEPSSENFKLLTLNVNSNDYKNAKLFNVAVGSGPGTAKLHLGNRKGTNSLLSDAGAENVGIEEVPIRTLDSVADELKLSKVSFVKIDVEGFELEVLKGARNVLSSSHPSLAMETHDFGPSEEEIGNYLRTFGYVVKSVRYRTHLGLLYANWNA